MTLEKFGDNTWATNGHALHHDTPIHPNRLERSPSEQTIRHDGNDLAHMHAEKARMMDKLANERSAIKLNRAERDIIRLVSGHRNDLAGKSQLMEALLLLSALLEVEYGQ